MNEDFLHFIWKFKNFIQNDLKTATGEPVEIIKAGMHNTNAGPDFLDARIKIADKLWAGSVEIHIKSSHWRQHGHSADDAYKNVILHVVLEDDSPGDPAIPCIELKERIRPHSLGQYQLMRGSKEWVPCAAQVQQVNEIKKHFWLDRMVAERMEQKAGLFLTALKENGNDWAETFYQFLGRNFGFKINSPAFEALTKALPQKYLSKHRPGILQLEALLFGQAGMLAKDFNDLYPNQLKKEYEFLSKKYRLTPIAVHQWNYLRLRPTNFPTIRISQFANLSQQSFHLFSQILEVENYNEITELFDVKASAYWEDHFVFDKHSSRKSVKNLGKESINNIVINTIVPVLYAYGQVKNLLPFKEKALRLLEETKAEHNSITENWENLSFKIKNAYDSQGLIHLKNNYCDHKLCLECAIGTEILRKSFS